MKNMDLITLSTVNLDILNSQINENQSVSQASVKEKEEQLKKLRDRRNMKRLQSQTSQSVLSKGPQQDINYSLDFLNSYSQEHFQTKSGKSVQFTESVLQNNLDQSMQHSQQNPIGEQSKSQVNEKDKQQEKSGPENKSMSELDKFLSKLNINYDEDIMQQLESQVSSKSRSAIAKFSPMTSQTIKQNVKVDKTPVVIQQINKSVESPSSNSIKEAIDRLDHSKSALYKDSQVNMLNSQQQEQQANYLQVSPHSINKRNSEIVSSKITISQVRSPSPSPSKREKQEILSMSQLVDELQSKIKEQIQTITGQKAQIFQLTSELEQKQLTNANLQTKIDGQNNKLLEQQTQFNNLQQQNQEIERQKLELEKQCEFLQQQLQTQQNINSKLIINQNNTMLNNEINQLKQQLQNEKNSVQNLQNDINQKQDSIQEQQQLINEQQDKIHELQERTQLLSEQIIKQNTLIKQQEDAHQTQYNEIIMLQTELERIPALQQKIDGLNQQIIKYKLLQNEHYQLQQNVELQNQQIDKLTQEKNQLQLLIKQLQNQMQQMEHTMFEQQNASKTQASQLQPQKTPFSCNTCQTYKQQVENLNQINADLSEKNALLQLKCTEYEKKLDEQIQLCKQERFASEQLQTSLKINTNEVEILTQNIEDYKLQLQKLQIQNQKLMNEVSAHEGEIKRQRTLLLDMDAAQQKASQLQQMLEKQEEVVKQLQDVDQVRKNQEKRIKELARNETQQDQAIKYVTNKYNEIRIELEKYEKALKASEDQRNTLQTEYKKTFTDNQQIIHEYQAVMEKMNQLTSENAEFKKLNEQQRIQLQQSEDERIKLMQAFEDYKGKTNVQVEKLMNLNKEKGVGIANM